jgi:hypothetical protein
MAMKWLMMLGLVLEVIGVVGLAVMAVEAIR